VARVSRRLVPLRIPSGWTVVFNAFVEIEDARALDEAEREALLSQDLLQLRAGDLILDLGWGPEGDAGGRYRLELARGDWDETLLRLEHPSAALMRDAIDLCLGQARPRRRPVLAPAAAERGGRAGLTPGKFAAARASS
jgi:hypothetical protein